MTTIEDEIAAWAASRPTWQQSVLVELARGHVFDQAEIDTIADQLVADAVPKPQALRATDISGVSGSRDSVAFVAIRDATNINALLNSQELTFADRGLTVIYGDNGSGKSGYARIIKAVVGARHQEPVHTNVFADSNGQPQNAEITFKVAGSEQPASSWPSGTSSDLRAISFYDEACGDAYIGGDSELTYRPSALVVLDGLISVCDEVRKVLDERLRQNEVARGPLPTAPDGSAPAKFLARLSGDTTKADVDAALTVPADAKDRLGEMLQEEARLRGTDPSKERTRIEALADKIVRLASHVESIGLGLSDTQAQQAVAARQKALDLRAAAVVASADKFEDEPLAGVGSETWRTLWAAARQFSEVEAYHGDHFPIVSEGAHCVLCQQELSAEGADRLSRFDRFMRDTTAQKAAVAERDLENASSAVQLLDVSPTQVSADLVDLESHDSSLAKAATEWLATAEARRAALVTKLKGDDVSIPPLGSTPEGLLKAQAATLRDRAQQIDAGQFQTDLGALVDRKNDLEGRLALGAHRPEILTEIARLADRRKLDEAKRLTDTGVITRKSSELTDAHVTSLVRDRFVRESDRLKLERIELKKTGGQKGRLRHRPSLLGAVDPQPVDEVLSEGEQTALGLAGFFTEAHFDGSKSALVLDDPVTSLDHVRRARVANRLAELSADRQIVVFTHELTFVGDLARAAAQHNVPFTERSIQRRGGKTPGLAVDEHPWKAKDVGRRLNELERLLARIKKERDSWSQDEYEKECADWAGKLSETWERLINLEIVSPLVDPSTSHVQPKMFRVLAKITATDDQEFQESYARCSAWVRRHDKSQGTNYVAPEPSELEDELALVRTWFERVKKYTN
jgi:energy-coupling factor transporter ATP-binding protein EcfA2